MNTLIRWHNRGQKSFAGIQATRPDAVTDEIISAFFRPAITGVPEIRLDVSEDERSYRVSAAMAGVKKEDIQVAVSKNEVTIEVEVKPETANAEIEKTLHRERFYGKTSRVFSLAEDIDDANIDARYVDGVLQLTLPKLAQANARRITIN